MRSRCVTRRCRLPRIEGSIGYWVWRAVDLENRWQAGVNHCCNAEADREEIGHRFDGRAPTRQDGPVLTIRFSGRDSFVAGVSEMLASGKHLNSLRVSMGSWWAGQGRCWAIGCGCHAPGTDLLAGAISLIEQSVARFFAGRLEPLAEAPPLPAPVKAPSCGIICRSCARGSPAGSRKKSGCGSGRFIGRRRIG